MGGTNTLASTVAFYALATVLPTSFAWTLVYAAGIAFVVLATPRYVFASSSSWGRRLMLVPLYVSTYLVGLAVIWLLEAALSLPRLVVVLGTVAITAPLSFLGARALVGAPGYASGSGSTPSG